MMNSFVLSLIVDLFKGELNVFFIVFGVFVVIFIMMVIFFGDCLIYVVFNSNVSFCIRVNLFFILLIIVDIF